MKKQINFYFSSAKSDSIHHSRNPPHVLERLQQTKNTAPHHNPYNLSTTFPKPLQSPDNDSEQDAGSPYSRTMVLFPSPRPASSQSSSKIQTLKSVKAKTKADQNAKYPQKEFVANKKFEYCIGKGVKNEREIEAKKRLDKERSMENEWKKERKERERKLKVQKEKEKAKQAAYASVPLIPSFIPEYKFQTITQDKSESQDFVIHNTKSGKSLLSMNSPSISKTHELSEIKNKQKWDNLVTSQFLPETHVFQATHTLPSNSSVENIRPSTVSETRPTFFSNTPSMSRYTFLHNYQSLSSQTEGKPSSLGQEPLQMLKDFEITTKLPVKELKHILIKQIKGVNEIFQTLLTKSFQLTAISEVFKKIMRSGGERFKDVDFSKLRALLKKTFKSIKKTATDLLDQDNLIRKKEKLASENQVLLDRIHKLESKYRLFLPPRPSTSSGETGTFHKKSKPPLPQTLTDAFSPELSTDKDLTNQLNQLKKRQHKLENDEFDESSPVTKGKKNKERKEAEDSEELEDIDKIEQIEVNKYKEDSKLRSTTSKGNTSKYTPSEKRETTFKKNLANIITDLEANEGENDAYKDSATIKTFVNCDNTGQRLSPPALLDSHEIQTLLEANLNLRNEKAKLKSITQNMKTVLGKKDQLLKEKDIIIQDLRDKKMRITTQVRQMRPIIKKKQKNNMNIQVKEEGNKYRKTQAKHTFSKYEGKKDLSFRNRLYNDKYQQVLLQVQTSGASEFARESIFECVPEELRNRIEILSEEYLSIKSLSVRLNTLIRIMTSLTEVHSHKDIMNIVKDLLPSILDAGWVHLWAFHPVENKISTLIEEKMIKLDLPYFKTEETREDGTKSIMEKGLMGIVIHQNQIFRGSNIQSHKAYDSSVDQLFGHKPYSVIMHPVVDKDNRIKGIIEVGSSIKQEFTEETQFLVSLLARTISSQFERKLNQQSPELQQNRNHIITNTSLKLLRITSNYAMNAISDSLLNPANFDDILSHLHQINNFALFNTKHKNKQRKMIENDQQLEENELEKLRGMRESVLETFVQKVQESVCFLLDSNQSRFLFKEKDQLVLFHYDQENECFMRREVQKDCGLCGDVFLSGSGGMINNPYNHKLYNTTIDIDTTMPLYTIPLFYFPATLKEEIQEDKIPFGVLQFVAKKKRNILTEGNHYLAVEDYIITSTQLLGYFIGEALKLIYSIPETKSGIQSS